MKILYVIPYFAPAWSYGGTVKASFDFAKELINLGHQVTVLTTDVLDAKSRNRKLRQKIKGVEIIRFKNISHGLAKKFNLYLPVGFHQWLKRNISDYDLVHIHEFFTYQSMVAAKTCCQYHKPFVIQPHGSLSLVAQETRFYLIKKFIIKRLASLMLVSLAIIALNDKERKDILSVLPQIKSKIKIVPNGLDLNEFKVIKKIDLHRRYHIPKDDKIIAFIGRIHFIKGLDVSFKALSRLKNKLNFTFLMIGPDEGEKSHLEALAQKFGIENQIIFTGLMTGRKKLETLKSTDLSLLNSRSEGLPTTLLESAALGLPIICSGESNLPAVSKYQAGFIVQSEVQVAQKISLILNDVSLRHQMSQNALKLAQSFNIKKCVQTLNDIYQTSFLRQ